jgi:alpha/beta superfamily hydrolase
VGSGIPHREALTIRGPAGQIEALLEEPTDARPDHVAVLCHPHPQFQGTMLNKVVHTLSRAMNSLGVPVLRFNFRGVGASEGEYAEGRGETEDTLAVADRALERYPGADLYLLGFSFGAMVAARAALTAEPAQLVTVAPAVSRLAGLLEGRQPACPWLIVQGDADEVVACDDVVNWVNQLEPGPELVVLPDVGHFFHGRLTLLRETVVAHFRKQRIDGAG